ncbi:MAG: ATP-binding protein [Ferruginibacter sp.]
MGILIGREEEKAILEEALISSQSEMIAVWAEGRVGKTFLIKQTYTKINFEFTGILNAPLAEQLENFTSKLIEYGAPKLIAMPTTWLQAFTLLKQLLKAKKTKAKKIIFIDELPWLDTPRARFMEALGHFWNDFAVNNNVVIVICGSAASWMIKKVVHNKGGLHNRITKLIELQPFTLKETAAFLKANKIVLSHYQITQLYMIMGGIPYYLKEIKKGASVAQNTDRICFKKNGLLKTEFEKLFNSLFTNADSHIAIVKALASKWKGLTRNDILYSTGFTDGGNITKVLEELEMSAFISTTQPFGKTKKDKLFRLSDPYSLFYLHFIAAQKKAVEGVFLNISKSPKWQSWCGYAFENTCLSHVDKIINALGIKAIYTETAGYIQKGNSKEQGIQIDLLIDRADRVINICEIKFYDAPFTITKDYAAKLRTAIARFRNATATKKSLFLTMITTYGVEKNIYASELVQNEITLDDLFL